MATSDKEKKGGRRWSLGDHAEPGEAATGRLRLALGLPDNATPFPWQQDLGRKRVVRNHVASAGTTFPIA